MDRRSGFVPSRLHALPFRKEALCKCFVTGSGYPADIKGHDARTGERRPCAQQRDEITQGPGAPGRWGTGCNLATCPLRRGRARRRCEHERDVGSAVGLMGSGRICSSGRDRQPHANASLTEPGWLSLLGHGTGGPGRRISSMRNRVAQGSGERELVHPARVPDKASRPG